MTEKVIAAVPTYNAGKQILELAAQLQTEDFDDIYVLDDATTDGSVDALEQKYPNFHVIRGDQNKGPGGNRNRMLQIVQDGIIVFIDADMSLRSHNIVETVQKELSDQTIGLLGGFILNKQLEPMDWNYGFEMHPRKDAWFTELCTLIRRPDIPNELKKMVAQKLKDGQADFQWILPDMFPMQRRDVDWVAEGLFAIRANTFKQINGYDENMRYHEGQDFAHRIRMLGMRAVFTPAIQTHHHELEVRSHRRADDFREGQFYFFHKHWGMSREVFERLYEEV